MDRAEGYWTDDLHGRQHGEKAVPGAAQRRRSSHVQGQAYGCEQQKPSRGTVLQAGNQLSAI